MFINLTGLFNTFESVYLITEYYQNFLVHRLLPTRGHNFQDMHHIVYQSCAIGQPTIAELKSLLQQARANNSRTGITGLLLYGNGGFLQVLEGEAEAVRQMYDTIKADYRHTRVFRLSDGAIRARVFPDWSMGFQTLSGDDFMRLTGYIDPYRSNFLDAHLPDIDESMLVLLKSFVTNDGPRL